MSKATIAKQISTLEAVSSPITLTYEDTLFTYKNKRSIKRDSAFKARIDELYEQNSTALMERSILHIFGFSIQWKDLGFPATSCTN